MTCCIIQGPLYAVRSSSKHHYTFEKCYETRRQQWMCFLVAEHLISCADRVPKIWYFAWNLGVVLCRKWHGFGNKELMCDVYSSSYHPYISRGDYDTLNQLWMYLLTAYHPMFRADRNTESDILYWILYLFSAENDMVLAMNGPHMLSEAPLTNIIYLRNIMRHMNSNGCLLLEDTIPFPVLRGYPKSDIFSWIWELFIWHAV